MHKSIPSELVRRLCSRKGLPTLGAASTLTLAKNTSETATRIAANKVQLRDFLADISKLKVY